MEFDLESWLVHAGTERGAGSPLAPPLLATSTYVSQGEPDPDRGYGRMANPGWAAVEEALAAAEGPGAQAVTFASGQAASMALMLALAAGRSRIVFPHDGYYNTRAMADKLRPHGAVAVAVDQLDLDVVEVALRAGPAVLWAETPTNPLLRVADLAALGALAAAADAPFVVDNTTATGLLQKPLDFGAVASVYSLTKSISGHSDVLGGAVVTRDAGAGRVGPVVDRGAARSHRSVRGWRWSCADEALPLRIARQSDNALAIAQFLAAQPRVTAVHYPGLAPSAVASLQMPRGFRAFYLLSFEIAGTAADADAVVAAARLVVPATSFGGVESTWERRARWAAETAPQTLIRLSAGIEPAADLVALTSGGLAVSGSGCRVRRRPQRARAFR